MNYLTTTEQTLSRTDEIIDYLRTPRLWIPQTDYCDFDMWLDKTHKHLKHENKRAILTIVDNSIAGVIIYQKHKTFKNISISPNHCGKYLASFMLKNAEVEGKHDFNVDSIHIDAKSNNLTIKQFLIKHKYTMLFTTNLYNLNEQPDIVYYKNIKENNNDN